MFIYYIYIYDLYIYIFIYVSVSLNFYHTKLHLQHLGTALVTMKLLKESSKHGITTRQYLSDTVNA